MIDRYHDTGRYGVVRYFDAKGVYYAVVDKQHPGLRNIVFTTRSQNVAHERADAMEAARA